ncbi:MAG TPA: hypothetical protein IAD48_08325 [Candidatus Limiplasma pullistercoris]|nr:hypothetical protein [Candidatus Limiplasma pullistercoris]
MNIHFPTWFPIAPKAQAGASGAQDAPEAPRHPVGQGPITGCDLSELTSLSEPFVRDPFDRLRPPFSREAAELSLELASMAYTLDLDPWAEAGWNDFSIQIDDTLQSGLTHGASADGERMRALINALKVRRAKAALRERNPVSQVMSALRQRERSDTIKAVCMMHPLPEGRFLLAIGFMGTGKRFYDWISNFRFTTEEGFHKGFYQLCTYFEQGAESIVFPATAQALGLEKLTLGEVLSEMKSLSSRFRLWMAGHSQGGGVMQVFCHRLMTDWGVLAQNVTGYGFASPTVATGRLVHDPAAYPLYHILNSDDMVPRMGALLHLGLCLEYPADDDFRERCYDLSPLPADVAARLALAPYQRAMVDTPTILMYGTAFFQCLAEEKGEEGLGSLLDRKWAIPAVDRMLQAAGGKAMDLLDRLIENAQNGHAALTGRPMDEQALAALRDRMRPVVHAFPFRRLMGAVLAYCMPPHHLVHRQQDGAYAVIVKDGLKRLRPFVWVNPARGMPMKRYARPSGSLTALRAQAAASGRRAARSPRADRARGMGVRRTGLTARRAGARR